jgi:hypothetical protein
METRLHALPKATAPSFAPVRDGVLQRNCACGGTPGPTGECEACRKKKMQRCPGNLSALSSTNHPPSSVSEVPPIVHEVLRAPGQPLDGHTRAFMEPRFGHDFSHVRVHTGARAAESAQAVNALAYTVGRDVVFDTRQYTPTTNAGQRLLAHELTHVVQQQRQGAATDGASRIDEVDLQGECEAETVASRVMLGLPVHVHHASHVLQRYGHANSCKDDEHLKPFVWPGHRHAEGITQRALEETDGRPLDPAVARRLRTFFGTNSTDPANVAKIHANFVKVQAALNQNYLYHCSRKGDRSDGDALPCKGQNAGTDQSGRKDITLCFDQVGGWSAPAAGWVIVHENVHRGLDFWGHTWEAGNVNACINKPASQATFEEERNNPDAYACSAALM